MYVTLRGLRRLALTSKSAAPKPAAVLAIEANIAERARDVAALNKKLNNAEAEVAKWSGIKFNPPPETNMSQANEALKFYTEQAAAAQTALDKANALLLDKRWLLVEKEILLLKQLNNEQQRQHDIAMARIHNRFASPAAFMAAMFGALESTQFPTTAAGYELEDLELDNPNRASVLERQVKQRWKGEGPDFLVTRLEEPVAQLTEYSWDEPDQQPTSMESKVATLKDMWEQSKLVAIVSPKGSGKTRAVFEEGRRRFGIYLSAFVGEGTHGIADLDSFLQTLPLDLPNTSWEQTESHKNHIMQFMRRVIVVRLAVFRYARKAFPGLEPKHWLLLQLFPGRFTQGKEVFDMAMRVADRYEVSDDFMGATWEQEFKFIAIDEAHVANNCLREVFPSLTADGKKRSALSILINAVVGLPRVSFVVSGTRLEISWVIEILGSIAAKKGGLPPQLMGCITTFDASGVQAAVNQGGYVGNVDSETLSRFCGRPQFATRLTEALIMGQDTGELEKQIIREFADRLERPAGSQTAYGEFRNAAAKWALRGEGGVSVNGALGLEIGVCALKRIVKDKTNTAAFVISEPLVVRAFGDKLEVDFEGLTNENPAEIGHRFEEYLALHAADLIEGSLLAASDVLEAAQDERFDGEWEIASPGGDARMGIQSKDGEEPRDIKTILECAGDVGPSIVFPGVNMGADVVIAARRKSDNRKLLVFVQATSTPEAKKNRRKEPEPRLEVYNDLVNVMKEALVLNIVIKFPARSTGKDRKPELVPALVAKSSASASTNDAKDTYLQVVFDASNVGEYLKPMAKGLERVKELKG